MKQGSKTMNINSLGMEKIINRFKNLYSGVISDCLDNMGLWNQNMDHAIRPLSNEMIVAGPAFTVYGSSERSTDKQIRLGPKVVDDLGLHQIIVMQTNGDMHTGHWGELLTNGAISKGASGAVIDGGIRDSKFIIELKFPLFYKFHCPGDARGRWNVTHIQETITVGNVLIHPGDFIFGDIDGVVVIPQQFIEETLIAAEAAVKEENEIRKQILNGRKLSDLYLEFEQF